MSYLGDYREVGSWMEGDSAIQSWSTESGVNRKGCLVKWDTKLVNEGLSSKIDAFRVKCCP